MKKEFLAVFQITKLITFEVDYYTLSTNSHPYFTTSANEFCRNKRDYNRCGQAQGILLPKNSKAWAFYEKWDCKHLEDLTQEEYDEMMSDLQVLMETYNYIKKDLDESKKPYHPCIGFSNIVEFSKQPLKKVKAS